MATTRSLLWPVAVEQYGYVTTQDARDAGVDPLELRKLAQRARLDHVAHGVYRFPEVPVTDRDEYMEALLATGAPDAVLSHDTALLVLDLCDINPTVVHVTLPREKRVRRRLERTVVHFEDLTPAQTTWWEGMRVATADTAIWQGMQSGVPRYLLAQALVTAANRGAITEAEHREAASALELL